MMQIMHTTLIFMRK